MYNILKECTHEAAKKALEGKPLSDESMNNAISDLRAKKASGELPADVYEQTEQGELCFAKEIMRLNGQRLRHRKKTITWISMIAVCFLLILTLSIGIPVYEDYRWKTMLIYSSLELSELDAIQIDNLYYYNKQKRAHFLWLDNVEKYDTILYYEKTKPVIIEESYRYKNIPVTMYIMNKKTTINKFFVDGFDKEIRVDKYKIKYTTESDNICGYFYNYYNYFFEIQNTDDSILEPILSNLTKN